MSKVNVLIYHRVAELKTDPQLLAVTPENFYKQMKFLKDNYKIFKFADNWNEDGYVITFDDGYVDNYIFAYPILKELNIPATIFVSTGGLNVDKEMWWDELERLILIAPPSKDSFALEDKIFGCKWDTSDDLHRQRFYKAFHWLIYKYSDTAIMKSWMEQLENWNSSSKTREIYRTLNCDECRELDNSGIIEIGGHTVNHFSLGKLSIQEQEYEIRTSIQTLSEILKRQIQTFSYPFGGKRDYNNDTIRILKKAGITKCAANYPGIWNENISNFDIPRNIVRDWNLGEFKNKMVV